MGREKSHGTANTVPQASAMTRRRATARSSLIERWATGCSLALSAEDGDREAGGPCASCSVLLAWHVRSPVMRECEGASTLPLLFEALGGIKTLPSHIYIYIHIMYRHVARYTAHVRNLNCCFVRGQATLSRPIAFPMSQFCDIVILCSQQWAGVCPGASFAVAPGAFLRARSGGWLQA